MPPFFVGLLGSLVRVQLHLSRQHVGFLSRYGATTNYLYSHIAVLVEIQPDFRIRLQLDDTGVAQVDSGTYLIRSLDRCSGQKRGAGADGISVHSNWLIVFGS